MAKKGKGNKRVPPSVRRAAKQEITGAVGQRGSALFAPDGMSADIKPPKAPELDLAYCNIRDAIRLGKADRALRLLEQANGGRKGHPPKFDIIKNLQDGGGMTLLHHACVPRNWEVPGREDLNAKERQIASRLPLYPVVEFLVVEKVDPWLKDNAGKTALNHFMGPSYVFFMPAIKKRHNTVSENLQKHMISTLGGGWVKSRPPGATSLELGFDDSGSFLVRDLPSMDESSFAQMLRRARSSLHSSPGVELYQEMIEFDEVQKFCPGLRQDFQDFLEMMQAAVQTVKGFTIQYDSKVKMGDAAPVGSESPFSLNISVRAAPDFLRKLYHWFLISAGEENPEALPHEAKEFTFRVANFAVWAVLVENKPGLSKLIEEEQEDAKAASLAEDPDGMIAVLKAMWSEVPRAPGQVPEAESAPGGLAP